MRNRLALLLLLVTRSSFADDYREPADFNRWVFETELAAFFSSDDVTDFAEAVRMNRPTKLRIDSFEYVGTPGKTTDVSIQCGDPCTPSKAVISQTVEGEGLHVLAEYSRLVDYPPFPRIPTLGHRYLFCASGSESADVKKVAEKLKLCGGIVFFESATDAQREAEGTETETTEDRILTLLVQRHGKPESYSPRTRIKITQDGKEVPSFANNPKRYHRHRWCGKYGDNLSAYCDATITMTLDPVNGQGTVVYATKPVYIFAQAKHDIVNERDWLYVILSSSNKMFFNYRKPDRCKGSIFFCGPPMAEKIVFRDSPEEAPNKE